MNEYEKKLKRYKELGRKPTSDDIFDMLRDSIASTPGVTPISTEEVLFYTEQTLSGHILVRVAKVVLPGNRSGAIKPAKIKKLRVGGPSPFRCPRGYFSTPGAFEAIGCWSYQNDLKNRPPLEPEPDPITELLKRKDIRKRLTPG